ncbi:2-amino-4-hydroxy-6-hydroxymethyldihydropteridinediphosphokinase [Tistlia consotensis]|uniref:2-amino-4-hydroxy-6-hydroxymethyldihydropteridine pyrophosphokinase n=1 Tax=Tistlia consotensis USBA 355 TaxID=560819 RepID=A0A1Y6BSZ0_9PROT|nr:2-amino-4-hydroxy-6-hydroxymethyldihydropteridine diphosphokinase [Tistlia consotensis]SMF18298.1 2-amino-4-hydroxy-6-hydroxymethyldihydropteridinediphosphokinase [Tistlia consotensis USBA 355]SNR39761.1 2-amino-4-hydroxy-6-hydroxymethyldihydropteridinediphosphokinase [Tistlia consotensis]
MSRIYVALGANLPHPTLGPPRAVLERALEELGARGVAIRRRSRWYRSAPVPPSGQPWFVNGVAEVASGLEPGALLTLLHDLEAGLGRVRSVPNAARIVDLDLIDWRGRVAAPGDWPLLPHPRLQERAFVLLPLQELAPDWRHPVSGTAIADLVAALPADQQAEPIEEEGPAPPPL